MFCLKAPLEQVKLMLSALSRLRRILNFSSSSLSQDLNPSSDTGPIGGFLSLRMYTGTSLLGVWLTLPLSPAQQRELISKLKSLSTKCLTLTGVSIINSLDCSKPL